MAKHIVLENLQKFWANLKPHVNFTAECTTVSSTQIKQVYIPAFVLEKGVHVTVDFKVANTHAAPTLKVNDDNEAAVIVGPDGALTSDQVKLIKGFCEFVYDGEHFVFLNSEEKIRNQVVYGDEPEQPFAGMIWLKPIEKASTSTNTEDDEQTLEEQLAEKDATIADLQEQIRLLQEQIAGEG